MKAVRFHQHGGPEVLRYEEAPDPRPGPGEAVLEVKACGVNHLDLWLRAGIPAYRLNLPHIPGSDIAGVVEELGEGATGAAAGDRVVVAPGVSCRICPACLAGRDNLCPQYALIGARRNGGYAQKVSVPAVNLHPIPEGLSFEEAAAFPLVFLTAWHMLIGLAEVRPGETVLVVAGASGVGSAAIQIARLAGASVFTTAGSSGKAAALRALGAEEVFLSSEPFGKQIRERTGGRGVDVVIEHVGPATWEQSLTALAAGGRLVTCGATTGPEVPLDLRRVFSRQIRIFGSYTGTMTEFLRVARLVGARRLRPVVDRVLPLARAEEAHRRIEERKQVGKLILTP